MQRGPVPGIALITDSASDLDADVAARSGIRIVPIEVRIGELPPEEVARLSPEEFWHVCANSDSLPETSAPSPGAFNDAFLRAADEGYTGVVCVTLSSTLSATYQAACSGAESVEDRVEVAVVDSRSVSLGQGMAVLEGVRRADAGGGLEEVCEVVRDQLSRTAIFGALDTLEHLRRGGRIGSAQAAFGSLLSIKPIIQVRDGEVVGEAKLRTRTRSLRYLVERVAKLGRLERLAIAHAVASDEDLGLLLELVGGLEVSEAPLVGHLGPVVSTHTGPGTVAICAVVP